MRISSKSEQMTMFSARRVASSAAQTTTTLHGTNAAQTLFSSPHWALSSAQSASLHLRANEHTLDRSQQLCVTNQRAILLPLSEDDSVGQERVKGDGNSGYQGSSGSPSSATASSSSYMLDFKLNTGQAWIIANPSMPSKPHICLLDTPKLLRFVESPSLSLVQNETTLTLPLHANEVVTGAVYDHQIGLLMATSQRRVILVSFFDSLGNVHLSHSEIFSDRSIWYYLMSSDLASQKTIKQLEIFNVSPVCKQLFILDTSNTLVVLNHIVSSGVFTEIRRLDLNEVVLGNTVHNFKVSNGGQSIIALCQQQHGSKLCVIGLDISAETSMEMKMNYPLETSLDCTYGELYFINEPTKLLLHLISQDHQDHIILLDVTQKLTIDQMFSLQKGTTLFHIKPYEHNQLFKLYTDDSILTLKYYSMPTSESTEQSITQRIEQYLLFGHTDSDVSYQVSDLGIDFTDDDIEHAVEHVMGQIITGDNAAKSSTIADPVTTLIKRVNMVKHLVVYLKGLNLRPDFIERVLSWAGKISIGCSFVESTFINNKESAAVDIDSIVVNTSYVLVLIDNFMVDPEVDIQTKAKIINDTFQGYLNIQHFVKSQLSVIGLVGSPLFTSEVLNHINEICQQFSQFLLDESKLDFTAQDSSANGDILCGLCQILYYVTNDSLLQSSNAEVETLLVSNLGSWTEPLCLFQTQSLLIALADEFHDLYTLAMLIDTQRAKVMELAFADRQQSEAKGIILYDEPVELVHEQTRIEALFEQFLAQYGYDFAIQLFEYYVNNDMVKHMLSLNDQSTNGLGAMLEQYLAENKHDARISKLIWIDQILQGQYAQCSEDLMSNARLETHSSNKLAMVAIAQLASLASDEPNASLIAHARNETRMLLLYQRICKAYGLADATHRGVFELVDECTDVADFAKQNDANVQLLFDYVQESTEDAAPLAARLLWSRLALASRDAIVSGADLTEIPLLRWIFSQRERGRSGPATLQDVLVGGANFAQQDAAVEGLLSSWGPFVALGHG